MPDTFLELGLNPQLVQAVTELGFEKPTSVQEIIIPKQLQENTDLVCLAQTGTGKTAAFGLPLLLTLDYDSKQPQALILCPTRELCRQIVDDLTRYARFCPDFSLAAVYGGSSIEVQLRALRHGVQVIVATPGRMVDLLERRAADLSHIERLILDEADEMLNMGFKEELDTILSYCPKERRTLLFSATLPLEVERIAKKYMYAPQIITVGIRNQGTDNVKHYYYVAQARDRYLALKRIVDYNPDIYAIIFCRTRQETQQVSDALIRNGYNADALHGELSQAQRDLVMNRFRNRSLRLLVATDVAARGIDVNDLTHVINYNLPDEPEQYTHRSGRTGRADKTGKSLVIINSRELNKITRIESILGKRFARAKIPTGREVCEKQLIHMIDQIEQTPVKDEIEDFMQLIEYKWAHLSKEDIVRRVLSIEFNRFLEYYRKAPDLNVTVQEKDDFEEKVGKDSQKRGRGEKKAGGSGVVSGAGPARKAETAAGGKASLTTGKPDKGFTFISLNIGFKQGLTPRHIIRLMTTCGLGKHGIGRIDLLKDTCLVEVSTSAVAQLKSKLNGSTYRNHTLTVSDF